MHRPPYLRAPALAAVLAAVVALPTSARGQTRTFTFEFAAGTTTATGSLTATPNATGTDLTVTGATGALSGGPIASGLLTFVPNPNAPDETRYSGNPNNFYDNQLRIGQSSLLTFSGLLFTTTNGVFTNIYAQDGEYSFYQRDDATGVGRRVEGGTFTLAEVVAPVSTVPEPGTWALVGTGLLAAAGVARRRAATT